MTPDLTTRVSPPPPLKQKVIWGGGVTKAKFLRESTLYKAKLAFPEGKGGSNQNTFRGRRGGGGGGAELMDIVWNNTILQRL